jgi:membrane fusion protein, copper/silver efflux system
MKSIGNYAAALLITASLAFAACGTTNKGTSGTNTQTDSNAVVYACPMHPEVTSNKPGNCPKCGMALVKKETQP